MCCCRKISPCVFQQTAWKMPTSILPVSWVGDGNRNDRGRTHIGMERTTEKSMVMSQDVMLIDGCPKTLLLVVVIPTSACGDAHLHRCWINWQMVIVAVCFNQQSGQFVSSFAPLHVVWKVQILWHAFESITRITVSNYHKMSLRWRWCPKSSSCVTLK